MLLMTVMTVPLLDRWARASQQGARRNAMVATTELTRRRIERDEVEGYLASLAPRTRNLTVAAATR
ncbi:MAG: hypothetical protein ACXWDL_14215 [Nocardioides sp.]